MSKKEKKAGAAFNRKWAVAILIAGIAVLAGIAAWMIPSAAPKALTFDDITDHKIRQAEYISVDDGQTFQDFDPDAKNKNAVLYGGTYKKIEDDNILTINGTYIFYDSDKHELFRLINLKKNVDEIQIGGKVTMYQRTPENKKN